MASDLQNSGGRGGKGSKGTRPFVERDRNKDVRLVGYVRSVVSGDTLLVLETPDKSKSNAPPGEFYLSLMGIKAPVLGKRVNKDGKDAQIIKDEPFAFESREFLRKLALGKPIVYRVEIEVESQGAGPKRKIGEAWLDGANLRFEIAAAGWAKPNVKERKPKEGQQFKINRDDETLLGLCEAAEAKKTGVWSENTRNAIRNVRYRDVATPEEQFDFFQKFKGKQVTGLVESVRSGTTLRLYLLDSSDEITVMLSGVRSPVYKFGNVAENEPHGLEAKMLTEHLVLNRVVTVVLDGLDRFNFFATIKFGEKKTNLALDLLQRGLAQFVEWSVANKNDIAAWKEAENKAKLGKLKIWKNFIAPKKEAQAGSAPKQVVGQVVEIANAGSIVVRIAKGNRVDDHKMNFSSIKVAPIPPKKKEKKAPPKKENAKDAPAKPVPQKKGKGGVPIDPEAEAKKKQADEDVATSWSLEAKEYLRKTLIGKTVHCTWDYVRPVNPGGHHQPENQEWRQFHSIYYQNKNIALELVSRGYATVAPHSDDETRSPEWKEMVLAERAAAAAGKGVHALKASAPLHRLRNNDLTENEHYPRNQINQRKNKDAEQKKGDPKRNQSFADDLKKARKIPAIVEYVTSCCRFRVSVPSKGYILSLSLAGLKVDQREKIEDGAPGDQNMNRLYPVATKDGKPIPPNVAFHFARNNLFQRDVLIEVDRIDAGGGFIGKLYFQQGQDWLDWGLKILAEGHAELSDFASRAISDPNVLKQYQDAEANAQIKQLNKWAGYDKAEADLRKQQEIEARKKRNNRANEDEPSGPFEQSRVTVTEIMSGSNFFFQLVHPNTESALKELESAFASSDFDSKPVYTPNFDPKQKGDKEKVAGRFTVDGNWYRAEILRVKAEAGKDTLYELRYIDYGNTEFVPASNIRKLPEELAKVNGGQGLATKARLAHISAPDLNQDYGRDAAAFFKELVWGKTMMANIHNLRPYDDGVRQVLLGDPETSSHINALLVKEGFARVDKYGPKSKENEPDTEYEILKKTEQEARTLRYGMWEYGDIGNSDDERAFQRLLR